VAPPTLAVAHGLRKELMVVVAAAAVGTKEGERAGRR
jgi:hypothetical protein